MDDCSALVGGFVISRPAPMVIDSNPTCQGFMLMSDFHIGAPNVDYGLINRELEEAAARNDRILINGDVFDMILCKDVKRFSPEVLHPRLRGRSDLINRAVDWGVEILAPYIKHIDMIALGNHETSVEKYHSTDVLRLLIDALQAKLPDDSRHVIHYGGYTGFVDYRFRSPERLEDSADPAAGCGRRFVIYYHHGSGGTSPTTRGVTDLFRKSTWVRTADVLWEGHKHTKLAVCSQELACPLTGYQPKIRDVAHVRTGAYFKTYNGMSQKKMKEFGRRSNYAADAGMALQGCGGIRVELKLSGKSRRIKVEQ